MPAKFAFSLASWLALLSLTSAQFASATEAEFALTAEITNRFGAPVDDHSRPPLPPHNSMMSDTPSDLEMCQTIYRGISAQASFGEPRVSLENKTGLQPESTYVEARIAAGFPEGRTARRISVPEGRDALVTPARAIDAPSEPALNHLAVEKTRHSARPSRIEVEGIALRFRDEIAFESGVTFSR